MPASAGSAILDRREKRRLATLASRPWLHATGPKTEAGKRRAAQNGKARQRAEKSVRELRAELSPFLALAKDMERARDEVDRLLCDHKAKGAR